jgi:hypothetical protein
MAWQGAEWRKALSNGENNGVMAARKCRKSIIGEIEKWRMK